MKNYKTVTLRSNSKSVINIPKDVWKELGWNLNDKLKLTFFYGDHACENQPEGLWVRRVEEHAE
tara:strand:+ start:11 stop:202 length:192 start_codon:yes stop_codon:yes gene_type:complete